MLSNMAISLILHEQIKTTLPKAKELRSYVEKLVTKASKDTSITTRRCLQPYLCNNHTAINKLFATLGVRYKDTKGGYTQIIKAGFRYGDMAPIAYIQFINRDVTQKGAHNKTHNDKSNIS
jgi:large subunit ribosomal protein L17